VKLAGSRTIATSRARVYAALLDPALLARTLPGCTSLEATAANTYAIAIEMGVGSIKGAYTGTVTIADLDPSNGYSMRVNATGGMGYVDATAHVALRDDGTATVLTYDADAEVGGRVAGVGQRLIAGVAKIVIDQFFRSFDRELTKTGASQR